MVTKCAKRVLTLTCKTKAAASENSFRRVGRIDGDATHAQLTHGPVIAGGVPQT